MATDISPQETSLDSLSGKENVEVVLDAEMQYRENEHKVRFINSMCVSRIKCHRHRLAAGRALDA